MVRNIIRAMCACAVLSSSDPSTVVAQRPELIVEVDRQEIYKGESVLYRVTLNHIENPTAPRLDGFDDFQVASVGERSLDSQRITIINGVRSQVIRRGREYSFQLTPLRTGNLTIPGPTTVVDGEQLQGNVVALRVIPPEDQDVVILEMNSDLTTVYPMQPFTLSLTMAIKALPADFR